MPLIEVISIPCPKCGKQKSFRLDANDVQKWRDGALIQNVWPAMSADDRETLMSGFCGPCFDEMFGEEE